MAEKQPTNEAPELVQRYDYHEKHIQQLAEEIKADADRLSRSPRSALPPHFTSFLLIEKIKRLDLHVRSQWVIRCHLDRMPKARTNRWTYASSPTY